GHCPIKKAAKRCTEMGWPVGPTLRRCHEIRCCYISGIELRTRLLLRGRVRDRTACRIHLASGHICEGVRCRDSARRICLWRIPVGHADRNYFADPETLKRIEDNGQVVFRYATASGEITPEANPNGSLHNIAGIVNEQRNVLGMMPHPDRSSESLLGSADGKLIFESMVNALAGTNAG